MAQAAPDRAMRVRADSSLSNVGANPMDGLASKRAPLGDTVNGPPSRMSGPARTRPGWFANVGGGSPREGFMGTVGVPPTSNIGPPDAAGMQPSPNGGPDRMGLMTNASVPYAKIARRLRHALMATSQTYQLLFALKERRDPVLKRKNREARRYTELSVPALNFFLSMDSEKPETHLDVQSVEEFIDRVDASGRAAKTGGWAFEGVVRYDEGAEDMYKPAEEVTEERMFVSVVSGHAVTFNTFGPNARPNTALYVIVKKMKVSNGSTPTFQQRPWEEKQVAPITANNKTPTPFQYTFWADYRYDTPPLSKLEYTDEFGFRHYGKAIYIGTVGSHAPQSPTYRDVGKCPWDLGTILKQPQFEIQVNHA